jgi:predicted metal-dependent hydrolase
MLKRLRRGREAIELKIQGLELPIVLRRSARARRFSLQVSEARRDAVLTLPAFSSYGEADEFLTRHIGWLKDRLAKLAEAVPFTDGSVIPLRGVSHRLEFAGSVRRRGVVWIETEGDTPILVVSGATEHAPRRLHDWLKRQVHADLRHCVDIHAKHLNLAPKRIVVRDQSTRWGSCSTTGALSFSWRLILAPPFVLDYLAAHEVAHLAEMNHGPRFWKLVARAVPRHQEARTWLSQHGASLHRYGA